MEFVINITTKDLAYATDWCGVKSGRDFNKFEEMNLTMGQSTNVRCPNISESPLSIECKVREIIPLGTHDMFIADVVNIKADEEYIDSATGKFDLERANPIAYSHGQYYDLGTKLGQFGWSVMKKKKK